MRNSKLKSFFLIIYFNLCEIEKGIYSIFIRPKYRFLPIDYDAYWRKRTPCGIQPRFEVIAKYIEPGAAVLDVGCGDGLMLEYLMKTKHIQPMGIDISAVAVELARQRKVEARVETLDELYHRNPQPKFDYVVISETLEHVPDPERFVCWGWKLCSKTLFLTFPNIAYFSHRLRLMFGKFPVQWAYHPSEHLRFWSISDFKYWIQGLGLPSANYKIYFYPSNGITIFNLHKIFPNLFCNQMVVVIKKRVVNVR